MKTFLSKSVLPTLLLIITGSFMATTNAEAGIWSRARGEANVLHTSAKALHDRVSHLDTTGRTTAILCELVEATCDMKDLVYDDAPWGLVRGQLHRIALLNDAMIASINQNCTLRDDRYICRELSDSKIDMSI